MANIHSLNIGGSTYVIEPKTVKINDVRGAERQTSFFADYTLTPWFNQNTGFNGNHWASGITMKGWNNHYQSWQLASGSTTELQSDLKFRIGANDVWEGWRKVILEGDAATSSYSIYVTYNPSSNNSYSVPFMDYGHSQNSKIYSDNTFNYNPYTNTLTATTFSGNATSATTARNATNIEVDATSTNGTYYLTFVNGTDGNRKSYVNSGISVNPATDTINTNISGNAATATHSDDVAINTKEHIISSGICLLDGIYEVPVILGACDCTIFSDQSNTDYFSLMTDYHPQNNNSNWLRYNFIDQTLKSTNFEGNLAGNASSATNVKVTATSTSANYPLILGPSTTTGGEIIASGNKSLYTDSANNLYYNPNTNDLTVHSGYIIMPMDDKKGIIPATNNYGQIGFSDRKFWKMHATTFHGNLTGNVTGNVTGNATTSTTATNSSYINVASSSTNNGSYMLTFVNGTGNRKAYTNSGVCVNPYSKTIIANQIRGFGNGSWSEDWGKATSYNGSISSGSAWAPVCAVRTKGGVWSMGHLWPGDSKNYLTFSYVGDSVRAENGNITLKLPVPKYNRLNFIPIGDQQYDGQPAVARIVTLSSAQYNAITTKDPNTLYLII